jgi:hypothetical protein
MMFEPIHSSAALSFAYYGEHEGWLQTFTQHRDSDAIERSNWDVLDLEFAAKYPDDVIIERFNHWAVGWTEVMLVRPGSVAVAVAQTYAERLDDYPILDEEAYGMLEWDEEWCVRCDRGMRKEHPLPRCPRFRGEAEREDIYWKWRTRRDT